MARDEKSKLLLCIPSIAQAMAAKGKDENERQGWLYLRKMMTKWLTGPVNRDGKSDKDPFWIDWDWVMKLPWYNPISVGKAPYIYPPTSPETEYRNFIWRFPVIPPDLLVPQEPIANIYNAEPVANMYNTASKRSLGSILARDGFLKEMAAGEVPFDFTTSPWEEWQEKYHIQRVVMQPIGINAQQAVLGSFTFRALAKGTTEWIKEGVHRIRVTGVSVFVHDIYNFAAGGLEWLGYWNCEEGTVDVWPTSGTLLENKDFRSYQDRYGLGHDYLVLSRPHEVEHCEEMVYEYPL
ncbi:MAG: DUF6402 family protein [Desulfobulbus sp.]|nr:DUF6402 family protein [Desulfobulbus sp.]